MRKTVVLNQAILNYDDAEEPTLAELEDPDTKAMKTIQYLRRK